MPVQPDEVLKALIEATAEAKQATRELHEAQKTAKTVVKEQKERIAMAIKQEVSEQIEAVGDDVRSDMKAFIDMTVEEIRTDWRIKLGLHD